MTIATQAVYRGGMLHPDRPLAFAEGTTVQIMVAEAPAGDDVVGRVAAAASIAEWVEATKSLPTDGGGYDIADALRRNREWSGESASP